MDVLPREKVSLLLLANTTPFNLSIKTNLIYIIVNYMGAGKHLFYYIHTYTHEHKKKKKLICLL